MPRPLSRQMPTGIQAPASNDISGGIDEASDGSRGYRIYLDVPTSGDIRVGTTWLPDPEMANTEGDPDPDAQPVASIKEALTLALDLYRAKGDAGAMESSDEAFTAGFSGTTSRS